MKRENLFQYAESLSISSSQYFLDAVFPVTAYALIYLTKSIAIFGGIHWLSQATYPEYSSRILFAASIIWSILSLLIAGNNLRNISKVPALNKNLILSITVLRDNTLNDKHTQAAMIMHDAIRGLLDSVIKFTNNKHAEAQAYICLSFLDSEFNLNFWSTYANIEWCIKPPIEQI